MQVTAVEFKQAVNRAASKRPMIKEMLGAVPVDAVHYLSLSGRCGFAITGDGELRCVFSSVKGVGHSLIRWAIEAGARKLDCFDGYLVDFYKRHGFVEVKRKPNWSEGGPDVVYMAIGG